jgi:hypothetical protein
VADGRADRVAQDVAVDLEGPLDRGTLAVAVLEMDVERSSSRRPSSDPSWT